MRNGFINELEILMQSDKRIILLTGDVGFGVLEGIYKSFPDRFYNMGIAEQNMVGTAAGLAASGFLPFVYSIAPFAILRPLEFIRDGVVFHNLPVRFVGTGGGFEYGDLGFTHFLLEDIAITRMYNNFHCYMPINNANAKDLLRNTFDKPFPIYYRVGKNAKSVTDDLIKQNDQSGVEKLFYSEDAKISVFTMSSVVDEGYNAFKKIDDKNGQIFNLYAITQMNPFPTETIIKIIKNSRRVITVESHFKNGGMGSIFAEIIAENKIDVDLVRLAISDIGGEIVASQQNMQKFYEIDSIAILKAVNK